MDNDYSEDSVVEQPVIALFRVFCWQTANCFDEKISENSTLGREPTNEAFFLRRTRDYC